MITDKISDNKMDNKHEKKLQKLQWAKMAEIISFSYLSEFKFEEFEWQLKNLFGHSSLFK